MRRSSPWRRAPFVLLAIAAPAAHSWQTTIAVAPVGGQTSLATLGLLKQHCIDHKDVSVRAICSNAEEEEACQQAICGCRLRGGHAFSQLSTFPALSTHIAPPAEAESPCSRQDHGPPDCSCEHCLALKAALEGATTLVICADELHPRLMEVEGSLVVCSPLLASAQTGRSLRQALCLIDAAAAAGRWKHVRLVRRPAPTGQRRRRRRRQPHRHKRCRLCVRRGSGLWKRVRLVRLPAPTGQRRRRQRRRPRRPLRRRALSGAVFTKY